LWQHSCNSLNGSCSNWGGEHWAGPGVVPSLVAELALSQLRQLLGVDSQVSSAWGETAEEAEAFPLVDADERP